MAKESSHQKRGWVQGAARSVVDQAIEHWAAVASVIGGALMTYLASITNWLAPYGLLAWAGIGVVAFLLFASGLFLIGAARQRLAHANYVRSKAQSSGVSVLASSHNEERIELSTFFHPFYQATENVRFENCELFGPANIVIQGCTLLHDGFAGCEIVIIRPDRPVVGGTVFRHCTFLRCEFFRVTFLMTIEGYRALPEEFRAGVPVISDGRVGDV